jgi:DNA repair ATPase RecN
MIDVEIKDFQAIDHLKFRIEGFTAVVGRSNIGKSSIIRALKAALAGAEGNDFVRHNPETCSRVTRGNKKCQCQCSVQFKFEDGRRLLWEKGDAINQYTAWSAEGEKTVFSSVGGKGTDAPSMLESGFTPVEIGQKKHLIQVADQFDPLFLLNLSGPAVADVLSDVAQLDDINQAMRSVSKDRKSAASTRRVREEDIKTLEGKLERYEDLDQAASRARRVEDSFQDVLSQQSRVDTASQFLEDYLRIGMALKALQQAVEPSLPELSPLNSSAIRYGEAHRMLGELEEGVREIRSLMGVQGVEVPDIQVVQAKAGQVRLASELYKRLAAVVIAIRDLRGVEDVVVPSDPCLKDKAASLQAVSQWHGRLHTLETSLEKYVGLEDVSLDLDPSALRQLKEKAVQAKEYLQRLQDLEEVISQTARNLEEASSEETAVLGEFTALGVCPTCTQQIAPGGHAH